MACNLWLDRVEAAGVLVQVSHLCYYEVRRELERLILASRKAGPSARAVAVRSLQRLEALVKRVGFPPFEVRTVVISAKLWAEARHLGYQTASDESLDADVILAATARRAGRGGRDVHVITTNVADLSRYVSACRWDDYPTD